MCQAHMFESEAVRKIIQSRLEQHTLLNAVNGQALILTMFNQISLILIAINRSYFSGKINFECHFSILF